MGDVIPISSSRQTLHAILCGGLDPAYAVFCEARQKMNAALVDWLATNPRPEHVEAEVDATIGAVTGIVACAPPAPGAA